MPKSLLKKMLHNCRLPLSVPVSLPSIMSLPPLIGHQEARARLADAVRTARLPQVIVISGPAGVGKQRLALWLAQLMFCERREREPCGQCRACRLVDGLAYADLHWFVPIPRPKAADPDKAVDEAAEAIAEVMEERRARPCTGRWTAWRATRWPPSGCCTSGRR